MAASSFDYTIRDQAKMYCNLVNEVEKKIIDEFSNPQLSDEFLNLNHNYAFERKMLRGILKLTQVADERKVFIHDNGTAIFDFQLKENISLLAVWEEQPGKLFKKVTEKPLKERVLQRESCEKNGVCKYIEQKDLLRLYLGNEQILEDNDRDIALEEVFSIHGGFVQGEGNTVNSYLRMLEANTFYIKLPVDIHLTENKEINEMFSISLTFGESPYISIVQPILLPYLSSTLNDLNHYRIYCFVYPTLPVPSEIEVNAVFYTNVGNCVTGNLENLNLKFEDYFLPIYFPLPFGEGKKELKTELFTKFWKGFKNLQEAVNSVKLIETSADRMITKVRGMFEPFLLDYEFDKKRYKVENPYEEAEWEEGILMKQYYGKKVNCSYDFNFDRLIEKNKMKESDGGFCKAQVIIFLCGKFHLLFKIKISHLSTIVKARSDCRKIIEYLDEFYEKWLE